MAYKVIILYRFYMPSYFLGTFTEYPYGAVKKNKQFLRWSVIALTIDIICIILFYFCLVQSDM